MLDPDLVVTQYWFLMLLFFFFSAFCLYNLLRGRATETCRVRESKDPPSRAVLLTLLVVFGLMTGLAYALAGSFIDGNVWVTIGSLFQLQPAKVPIYLAFFLLGIHVERRNWLPCILGIGRPAAWFVISALMTAAYITAVLMTFPLAEPSVALQFTARTLRIFFVLTLTMFLLSFFHRYLNRSANIWQELSFNSYNIYLIHMVPSGCAADARPVMARVIAAEVYRCFSAHHAHQLPDQSLSGQEIHLRNHPGDGDALHRHESVFQVTARKEGNQYLCFTIGVGSLDKTPPDYYKYYRNGDI